MKKFTKPEILEIIYDTLAGNTLYKQWDVKNVENCSIDYTSKKIFITLKNGYTIELQATINKAI